MKVTATFTFGIHHKVPINLATASIDQLVLAWFATNQRENAKAHHALGIALSRRIRAHQRSARTAA